MIFSGRNLVKYPYSCYGYTRGGGKTWHGGIDVCGMDDDKIRMPGYNGKSIAGTVVTARIVTNKSNKTWEWGYYICVKLDANQTPDAVNYLYFCHCSKLLASVGQKVKTGDVLEMDDESAKVTGHVQTGSILVDGLGVGDVGNIVLRDRQHLAEDGIVIAVLTLERYSNQILSGPDIVSRGFVYVREAEDLMEEAREIVQTAMEGCISHHVTDWGKMKTAIRDTLGEFLWKRTKRRPMILPIIMEVE